MSAQQYWEQNSMSICQLESGDLLTERVATTAEGLTDVTTLGFMNDRLLSGALLRCL